MQQQPDHTPQGGTPSQVQAPVQGQPQQIPQESAYPQQQQAQQQANTQTIPAYYPPSTPQQQPRPGTPPQGGTPVQPQQHPQGQARPMPPGYPQQQFQGQSQPSPQHNPAYYPPNPAQQQPGPPQQKAMQPQPYGPGQPQPMQQGMPQYQPQRQQQQPNPAYYPPSPRQQAYPSPQQYGPPVNTPPSNQMDDYIGITQEGNNRKLISLEKEFMPTLHDAFGIAMKNSLSIVLAIIFWLLTIWIPYINMGTTIALFTMPIALSRNKPVSPTFIFDKRYRQFFGEFTLTVGLMIAGLAGALLLAALPALVVLITWSLAPLLVLDKGVNATEALTLSNKYTYGNKFLIFILFLCLYFALGCMLLILGLVMGAIAEPLAYLAVLIAIILVPATTVGLHAAIYKRLVLQRTE